MARLSPAGDTLTAHTTLVEDDIDPFCAFSAGDFAWWHDGSGFVASGETLRAPAPEVEAWLSRIAVVDEVNERATGAIAVGALPFQPGQPAQVCVPARVLGKAKSGRRWMTRIGTFDDPPLSDLPEPTEFRVSSGMSMSHWRGAVGAALSRIRRDGLRKVVLARDVTVTADTRIDIRRLLERLRAAQPAGYVFAAGELVGASPELLVDRRGRTVRSRPMAGTVPSSDRSSLRALAASRKDAWEHEIVVREVVSGLAPYCSASLAADKPDATAVGGLAHLATTITGELCLPGPTALQLARALHPTPAVGGDPTDLALELITSLEPRPRGCYAGPVGWVDAGGDGEFAVALRCAEIRANQAVLRAGAGIVAGSEWASEWRETQAKLEPMLGVLVRP